LGRFYGWVEVDKGEEEHKGRRHVFAPEIRFYSAFAGRLEGLSKRWHCRQCES
jgi:hypothetical protein